MRWETEWSSPHHLGGPSKAPKGVESHLFLEYAPRRTPPLFSQVHSALWSRQAWDACTCCLLRGGVCTLIDIYILIRHNCTRVRNVAQVLLDLPFLSLYTYILFLPEFSLPPHHTRNACHRERESLILALLSVAQHISAGARERESNISLTIRISEWGKTRREREIRTRGCLFFVLCQRTQFSGRGR